jgi:hypothetical protein
MQCFQTSSSPAEVAVVDFVNFGQSLHQIQNLLLHLLQDQTRLADQTRIRIVVAVAVEVEVAADFVED